MTKYAK